MNRTPLFIQLLNKWLPQVDSGRHGVTCLCEIGQRPPECTLTGGPLIPVSVHHPQQAGPIPWTPPAPPHGQRSLCLVIEGSHSQMTENTETAPASPSDGITHKQDCPPHPACPGPQPATADSPEPPTQKARKSSIDHRNPAGDPVFARVVGEKVAQAGGDVRQGPSRPPGGKLKAQILSGTRKTFHQ